VKREHWTLLLTALHVASGETAGKASELGQTNPALKQYRFIDICINNAIIGVQEQNTYAQTEGERRPARRSTQASLGVAGFWLLSQRSGAAYRLQCKFCDALA
jgi:hypothetical protein